MNASPAPTTEPQLNSTVLDQQVTFLVVGVDDLAHPMARLESLWLITLKTAASQIDFLPLYPDTTDPNWNSYHTPGVPILVPSSDYEFFSDMIILKNLEAEWSGVILLDLTGLNMLVEIAGDRINPSSDHSTYEKLGLPKAWEEPDDSLLKQMNVLLFLCENPGAFSSFERISYLMESIPDHFRSDLAIEDLWGHWQLMSNLNFDLQCYCAWQVSP